MMATQQAERAEPIPLRWAMADEDTAGSYARSFVQDEDDILQRRAALQSSRHELGRVHMGALRHARALSVNLPPQPPPQPVLTVVASPPPQNTVSAPTSPKQMAISVPAKEVKEPVYNMPSTTSTSSTTIVATVPAVRATSAQPHSSVSFTKPPSSPQSQPTSVDLDLEEMAKEQLVNLQIERDWFARCEVVPSAEAIMAKIKECRRGLATKEYLKRCEETPSEWRLTSFESAEYTFPCYASILHFSAVIRGFLGVDGWTELNIKLPKGKPVKTCVSPKAPWHLPQIQSAFECLGCAADDELSKLKNYTAPLPSAAHTINRALEFVVRAWELLTHPVTTSSFPNFVPTTTVLDPSLGEDCLVEFGVVGGEVCLKVYMLHVEWTQKKKYHNENNLYLTAYRGNWGTGKGGIGRLESHGTSQINGVWCKSYHYQECWIATLASYEMHMCLPFLTSAYRGVCAVLAELSALRDRISPLMQ